MSIKSRLILLGMLLAPGMGLAQSVPRIIQCEECTPSQMEMMAISLGETYAGSFYVFSLDQKELARYWVDYDREGRRWIATAVEPHESIVEMFGHMFDAHVSRPGAFRGQQTFQAPVAAVGGAHDPVAVAIRGRHDRAYNSFMAAVEECLLSEACAAEIDPTLATMLLAERKARLNGFSLWAPSPATVAWDGPRPRIAVLFCNASADCANVEYGESGWTYTETRSDGGLGKRYPAYGEDAHYGFDGPDAAARFARSLTNAGARVRGKWHEGADLACETAYATASCVFQVPSPER